MNEPHCIRTGMCCQRIPLPVSPRQLRESYEEWLRRRTDGGAMKIQMNAATANLEWGTVYQDIHLIYPMLKDRCLGKVILPAATKAEREAEEQPKRTYSYIYGPCRFFERDSFDAGGKRKLGRCAIVDHQPEMCRSYPNGNAGTFRGCGHNINRPEDGLTFDYFAKLEPLSPEER